MPPKRGLVRSNPISYSCTACAKTIDSASDAKLHPLVGCLVCRKCCYTYANGDFGALWTDGLDEYGDDNYCRWCCDGGELFGCMNEQEDGRCHFSFCKECIERNVPDDVILTLEQLDEDGKKEIRWHCFACDSTKLKLLNRNARTVIKELTAKELKKRVDESFSPQAKRRAPQPKSLKQNFPVGAFITPLKNSSQKTSTPLDNLPPKTSTPLDNLHQKTSTPLDNLSKKTTAPADNSSQKTTAPVENLPQKPAAPAEKLPQKPSASVEKLPQKPSASVEKLPQKPPSSVEKLPQKSSASVEKLPQKSTGPIEKLPPKSIAPLEKLPPKPSAPVENLPQKLTTPVDSLPKKPSTSVEILPQKASTPLKSLHQKPTNSVDNLLKKPTSIVDNQPDKSLVPLKSLPQKPKTPLNFTSSSAGNHVTNETSHSSSLSQKEIEELNKTICIGASLSENDLKQRLDIYRRTKEYCIKEIGSKFETIVDLFKLTRSNKGPQTKKLINLQIDSLRKPILEFESMLSDLKQQAIHCD